MKTVHHLLLTAALLVPSITHAQTSEVPGFISYQGRVLDNTGSLVGKGTPINRTVTFRIWDHPSNTLIGNLVYSEQQTVTISEGEFSVLVGQGVATTSSPFGYAEGSKGVPTVRITNAFGGAQRYLGVTVDDGTAAVDNEITPRQRIVTTAFAFRSKVAEEVNGKVTVTAAGGATFANGATINAAGATISGATFSGNGSGLTNLAGTNLADATVSAAKLGADVGLWAVNGSNVYRSGGRVGIGTSAPASNLHIFKGASGQPLTNFGAIIENNSNTYLQLNSPDNRFSGLVFGRNGNGQNGAIYYTPDESFRFDTNSGTNRMVISNTGNVGIGTSSPTNRLSVFGAADMTKAAIGTTVSGIRLDVAIPTPSDKMTLGTENGIALGLGQRAAGKYGLYFGTSGGGNSWIQAGRTDSATAYNINLQASGGNVGIGTTNPSKGKLHIALGGGSNPYSGTIGFLTKTGDGHADLGTRASSPALYAAGEIWALAYFAQSDERIKQVAGRSDGASDLTTLLGIEVTDYTYIDTLYKGVGEHKKVIAQQVEKVFPQAVKQSTDVVSDIYRKAAIKDGWVKLATTLKKGDRVRLIGEKKEGIHEVLELADGRFRTAFDADGDEVFVYGREVDDFRSVDYEAIAMLNVSATQQIKKEKDAEVKALQQENAVLRASLAAQEARLTQLESRDKERDAKFAALEELLAPSTRTVSHQLGAAVE